MKDVLDRLNPEFAANLSEEAINNLRDQLQQNKAKLGEQESIIKNLETDREALIVKRTELEGRLANLEVDYEEILEKAIADEETAMDRNLDLTDTIAELKVK